jgi:predicted nucleic acid-binding protein
MAYYTFDTSVIISRKLSEMPDNFLFSAVVLLELTASATDDSERKRYEALARDYRKDNSLIIPSFEDWLLASKVLYWLTQERRRHAKGRAPRLNPGASQRMALDALIATSARSWRTTVITDNWDDFRAIQRYCNFKLIRSTDFFGG